MEELDGPPSPENQNLQNWQIVFFPGSFGGGRALTAIRQEAEKLKKAGANVIIPSSISTPEGGKSPSNKYSEVMDLLEERRKSLIIGHSLGAVELLDFLTSEKEKIKELPEIEVVLISPIGTEVSKSIKLVRKLLRLFKDVSFAEQHIACPVAEAFYKEESEKRLSSFWNDDENKREERRISFLNYFGNEEIKGKKLKEIIEEIDRHILKALENNDKKQLKKLLEERGRILGPFIQRLFAGEHIDEETHRKFMELHKDILDQKSLFYLANLIQYFLKNVFPLIFFRENLLDKLKQLINVKITLVSLERDYIISPADVEELRKLHPEISFVSIPQLAHSSIGYYPQPLIEFINKLLNK